MSRVMIIPSIRDMIYRIGTTGWKSSMFKINEIKKTRTNSGKKHIACRMDNGKPRKLTNTTKNMK